MIEKIYVSPSNQSGNTYATGNTNEKEQCAKIAATCVALLEKAGFQVMCTYNDDMYARVRESNAFGADIHLAIHTNATAKHNVTGGSQVLLYDLSDERTRLGNAILSRLAPLTPGSSAERLVKKSDFYEVYKATGITAYCECEFHDTKEGSDFIISNTEAIGAAIASGICDYFGVEFVPDAVSENTATKNEGVNELVKQFQEAAIKDGLGYILKSGADGIWGPECEEVAKTAQLMLRDEYLYKNLTAFAQSKIGIKADGLFDIATKNCAILYQTYFGLHVDGIIGPKTWKHILNIR